MVESQFSMIKPSLETPFHIDFSWWKENDNNWQVFLKGFLCEYHQEKFSSLLPSDLIDWVDPKTAEVKRVDAIQQTLISHCAKQEGFLTNQTTLVESVFRLFLSNGNSPLTSKEIAEKLERQPIIILKTLSSSTVYRGIRPVPRK